MSQELRAVILWLPVTHCRARGKPTQLRAPVCASARLRLANTQFPDGANLLITMAGKRMESIPGDFTCSEPLSC